MDASAVLETISKQNKESLKAISVHKDIDPTLDVGNLLSDDVNPLNEMLLQEKKEEYLKSLARDNTQILFNEIWKLPVERVKDAVIVKIPEPRTILPRAKKIPQPKPPTKWEEFARMRGIRKQPKSGKVWDEDTKEWKPRWGYKRANDDTKDWLIEVPQNADPNEDQFAKRIEEKKERTAKNEFQRLRNIARRSGKPMVLGAESVAGLKQTPKEISETFHHAKRATASLGKFENKLKNEKPARNMGKKRKYDPLFGNLNKEKSKQMNILNHISKNTPTLNVQKAVNLQIEMENRSHEGRKKSQAKPRRSKRGRNK